jgi:hypothetical protein
MKTSKFKVDSGLATRADGGEDDPNSSNFTPSINPLELDSQMNYFRKIPDWLEFHPKSNDPDFVAIVARLSMMARFSQPRQSSFHGKTIDLSIGQLTLGRKQLSQLTGVEQSKCYRLLKSLQSEQRVNIETDNQCSLITCAWIDDKSDSEQRSCETMNNERTTNEQRMNTNTDVRGSDVQIQLKSANALLSAPMATDVNASVEKSSQKISKRKSTKVEQTPISEFAIKRATAFVNNQKKIRPNIAITIEDQSRAFQDILDAQYSEQEILQVLEFILNHRSGNFSWFDQIQSARKLLTKPKKDSKYNSYFNWMDVFIDIRRES